MIKDREKKKEALRKRIVQFNETDFKEQTNRKPIKNIKQKMIISIIIISFVFILLLTLLYFRKYTHISTSFTKTLSESANKYSKNNVLYESFLDGVVRYSIDGASYIDKNGDTKWNVTYNMTNPKVKTNGDYFVIADVNGANFYLFTKLGKLSNIESNGIIEKFSISKNGDVAILTKNSNESFIYLYDRSGATGDVYIKYVYNEEGQPLDLSLSDDSKMLMVSLLKFDNDKMYSYVNIYSLDKEVQVNNDNRILYYLDEYYNDKLIIKTDFLNNEKAVAFYDGGVTFFDIKNGIVSNKNIIEENIIHSVYVEKNYVYLIIENEDNKKNAYTLKKYDKNGSLKLKKSFNKEYATFYVSNGCSMFIGINDLMIIDDRGIIRYDDKFLDNFIYVKNIKHFLFMDILVGMENSLKRMVLY